MKLLPIFGLKVGNGWGERKGSSLLVVFSPFSRNSESCVVQKYRNEV